MSDAFLDEVARLLPDVDVVRLRPPDPTIEPVPEEIARQHWRDEVRRVAAALVTGWPVWLPSIPTPEQVTVGWSIGDRIDEAAVDVAGRVHGDHDVDVESSGAALESAGWAVTVQEQGGSNVRLIGRRGGDRAELIVRPSEQVVLARVVGAPIRLGAFAEPLVRGGPAQPAVAGPSLTGESP